MAIKIAIIGAGSIGFTRRLTYDILTVPELRDTTFALHDISPRNLDMISRILQKDVEANKVPAKIVATSDRREALADADYVINTARVGGLDAFKLDVDIPLKYGVDQCVGDTLCAGGILYGQRGIACMADWCKDIQEVAKPEALLLNYGNPNAMLTWAANEFFGIPTLGLCHGVQGGHWQLCKVIELIINKGKKPGSKGYREVNMKDVDITAAGINHQTWYTHILFDGEYWAEDAERLAKGFEAHPEYSKTEKVRIDILRRFGYYSTESNGHLSEYVPWYRKRPSEIRKWIDMGCWINGETGGYLRVCQEGRNWFKADFPKMLKEPWMLDPPNRSQEHGSYIIEALETGRPYRGHFNIVNFSAIPNLPEDAIVEVPCYVDKNGVTPPQLDPLPDGPAAVCNQSISVQRLAVKSAVAGDIYTLKQAMMLDPLVGAVCTTPEIDQMTDEMVVAEAKWLPQYKGEIAAAKKRLAAGPRLGTHGTKGAARKEMADVKTVAERNAKTAAKRKAGKKLDVAEPEG